MTNKELEEKIDELFDESIPALDLHATDCAIHDESYPDECTCKLSELKQQVKNLLSTEKADVGSESRMDTYKKWVVVLANMVYMYNGSEDEVRTANAARTLRDMIENEKNIKPSAEREGK